MTRELRLAALVRNEEVVAEVLRECWAGLDQKVRRPDDLLAMTHRVLDVAKAGYLDPIILRSAALFRN